MFSVLLATRRAIADSSGEDSADKTRIVEPIHVHTLTDKTNRQTRQNLAE